MHFMTDNDSIGEAICKRAEALSVSSGCRVGRGGREALSARSGCRGQHALLPGANPQGPLCNHVRAERGTCQAPAGARIVLSCAPAIWSPGAQRLCYPAAPGKPLQSTRATAPWPRPVMSVVGRTVTPHVSSCLGLPTAPACTFRNHCTVGAPTTALPEEPPCRLLRW